MLRLSLLVFLLTHSTRTAHVTETPNKFDSLYRKIERLNAPNPESNPLPTNRLFEKLDRLNSLEPDRVELTEEDEELLSAMQSWLSTRQMDGVVKDLQRFKVESQDSEQEYGDSDLNDEDPEGSEDYPLNDDWDIDDISDAGSTSKPSIMAVTPSAIIRPGPVKTVVSAAAAVAATEARPRIIVEPNMTLMERSQMITAVHQRTTAMVRGEECLVPQARWFVVKQLAPATGIAYTPPCVQLHRCAPDSGCCTNNSEVCTPIEGKHIRLPFFLHKTIGPMEIVHMQFYNHTQCGCVSKSGLESTMKLRAGMGMMGVGNPTYESHEEEKPSREAERQNDWRVPTEEPRLIKEEEDTTAPPQLRRCTCPGLFLASMTDNTPCSCVCEWPDSHRRRGCQSLARGKEHFGLRDRVCVKLGDCTPPSCEYGPYDRTHGRCPVRKIRRIRYHRGRYHEKTVAV